MKCTTHFLVSFPGCNDPVFQICTSEW